MKTSSAMKSLWLVAALALTSQPLLAQSSGDNSAAQPPQQTSRWPALMAPGMRATDLARSTRFYSDVLGMEVKAKREQGPFTELIFGFAGKDREPGIILFQTQGPDATLPVDHGNADSKIIIGVPDVAAVAERIKQGGYRAEAIHHSGPYQILMAYDPDGYALEIVQHPAP